MIQRLLSECQVRAVHIVRHIDVLDVLAHKGTLDMKALEIGRRHHDNIRLHLHHQHDQLVLTDIIWLKPVTLHLKNTVLRIARDIADHHVRLLQKSFYDVLVIFVKPVFF